MLQAPVATSVSGKGVFPENHPLAVGWGYGPQGTHTAEQVFKDVDLVLAIGVRYSEVSTAFYSIPQHRHLIQVDINPDNLGRVVKPEVCVHADAGLFLEPRWSRPTSSAGRPTPALSSQIRALNGGSPATRRRYARSAASIRWPWCWRCGVPAGPTPWCSST